MTHLSISRAWDETRAIIAHDGRLLASIALALIVLPQTILGVVGPPMGPDASAVSELVYVVAILIGIAGQIAFTRLAIGPSTTVGAAIGRGFARLGPVLAVFILLGIVVLILLIVVSMPLVAAGALLITPGGQPPPLLVLLMAVLLAVGLAVLQLAIPAGAVEAGGPIRLFRRSWTLARGNYLRLLGFVILVFFGIALIGLVSRLVFGSLVIVALGQPGPGSVAALVLGAISATIQAAFTVVTAVMLARIYVQLAGGHPAEVGVPSSGI